MTNLFSNKRTGVNESLKTPPGEFNHQQWFQGSFGCQSIKGQSNISVICLCNTRTLQLLHWTGTL